MTSLESIFILALSRKWILIKRVHRDGAFMNSQYTYLDWLVFLVYFAGLAFIGGYFSRKKATNSEEYFLGGHAMPMWVVAVSVLATSQSAASFLGGPDQGYQGNLTYLATNIGAFIAALFVAYVLIPKFYQHKVSTVYELLAIRFGESAKQQAGLMYLFGRIFASGARLYLAAIAVSMILFSNIEAQSVLISIMTLSVLGVAYSVVGGIRSVIYTDAIQCFVYIAAALAVVVFLINAINLDLSSLITALSEPDENGLSKLTVFDFNFDFGASSVFSFWSAISGFVLLNIASFGLDQDMTQRVLTCKSAKQGAKAILLSVFMILPVMAIFMLIGLLLYVFYQRPDLIGTAAEGDIVRQFAGQDITIFMYYILNEIPEGLRGLITVGVIAAALSTLNSGLNSMSSVVIQDFYRPWRSKTNTPSTDAHYVKAGQLGMVTFALVLALMAMLCFYWQQYSQMPLLAFALSVMVFSYSGLLGVYFCALFTQRGSSASVLWALICGAMITFLLQPYVLAAIGPSFASVDIGFTWQLCIGTLCSFSVCCLGQSQPQTQSEFAVASASR
jgi:SSS family solute:Na+ symporter